MARKKIGRNEPCWCGSGKKYKRCHLNRADENPVQPWEAGKAMREKFSRKVCSVPKFMHKECVSKIIKAHTVPKSSSLKAIAVDGHVLGLKMGLENIQRHNGKLKPEPIGINNASTFTGFCQKHDDFLFASLEKYNFRKTDKQCFLLAYRSLSRELYTKSALVDMYDVNSSLDKGRSINRQFEIQEQAFLTNIGATAGLNDNLFHKEKFDVCIEQDEYSKIRSVIFEYLEPFPIQVSGSVNPDFDFRNRKIQDLSDFNIVPDILSVTSFFDGEKGYIVFSWMDHCHKACEELVNSLFTKPREDLSVYLAQYIFSNFENYFISPKWWDNISLRDRDIIVNLSLDNVSLHVEPHGNSIFHKLLGCSFPSVESIGYVNWSAKE